VDRDVYQEWFELETDHWWFVGRRRLYMNLIEQTLREAPLPSRSRPRIVDIGCGTGVNLDSLARFGTVIGVDVSETALNFCRKRQARLLCRAGMDRLPFDSGSIDLVTAFDVLEHGRDDQAMLEEAYRVSAPGGWAFFSVPAYPFMWGDHDRAAHHYRRYTARELTRKVAAGGFRLHRTTFLNCFLFPVSVVFRQGKNLLRAAYRLLGMRKGFRTDFRFTEPPLINRLLLEIFASEAHALKHLNLPFGLSICCIARKGLIPEQPRNPRTA
jgi:SAM-dependent methyltransferase